MSQGEGRYQLRLLRALKTWTSGSFVSWGFPESGPVIPEGYDPAAPQCTEPELRRTLYGTSDTKWTQDRELYDGLRSLERRGRVRLFTVHVGGWRCLRGRILGGVRSTRLVQYVRPESVSRILEKRGAPLRRSGKRF